MQSDMQQQYMCVILKFKQILRLYIIKLTNNLKMENQKLDQILNATFFKLKAIYA